MILKSLSLENFRTYSKLYLEFCKNINIIYGENGIGKTNILEAIYLSCITKSYRVKKDIECLKFDENMYNLESIFELEKKSEIESVQVYLEKNAAGSYTVRLLKAGEKNNDEILKEYFVEKNVEEQIVGGKRKISQAMQDAREWVFEVSKKDDKYLKNLMLAAIHIKKNIDDYNLNTDELPQGECQGINFKELINKYKNQVVEEAYNSIISMEGGEEDLAKYLMYNYEEENKNGVIREVFTTSYVESSLRSKVYERAKKDVDGRYGGLIAESIAFGVFAAYYGAIAAACLFPAFLVPLAIAVGFTAASITAAVKADKLYNDVSKHADNAIRVVGENFKEAKNKINGKLELIRDAREVLETELKTLNFMYSSTIFITSSIVFIKLSKFVA